MRWEGWGESGSGVANLLFPEDYPHKDRLLEEGQVLIRVIEAATFDEAMAENWKLNGWDPYIPYGG